MSDMVFYVTVVAKDVRDENDIAVQEVRSRLRDLNQLLDQSIFDIEVDWEEEEDD